MLIATSTLARRWGLLFAVLVLASDVATSLQPDRALCTQPLAKYCDSVGNCPAYADALRDAKAAAERRLYWVALGTCGDLRFIHRSVRVVTIETLFFNSHGQVVAVRTQGDHIIPPCGARFHFGSELSCEMKVEVRFGGFGDKK